VPGLASVLFGSVYPQLMGKVTSGGPTALVDGNRFHVFWNIHHLYFVFFVCLFAHSNISTEPMIYKFTILPFAM
jgi:hypothetical protein